MHVLCRQEDEDCNERQPQAELDNPKALSAASSKAGSSGAGPEVGLQWEIPTVENQIFRDNLAL